MSRVPPPGSPPATGVWRGSFGRQKYLMGSPQLSQFSAPPSGSPATWGMEGVLWLSECRIGSLDLFVAAFSAPLIDAGVCYVRNPRSLACFVFNMMRAALNRRRGSLLSNALSKMD
jgi:hypothetical protein